jgi:hypothetical protein
MDEREMKAGIKQEGEITDELRVYTAVTGIITRAVSRIYMRIKSRPLVKSI